ncbi:MAG: NB-ARC domain-containing protein [Caldilineaceae bacterium]
MSMKLANQPDSTNLYEAVRLALRQWHGDNNAPSPIGHLYLFRKVQRNGYTTLRRTTNQVLLDAMEELQQTHEHDMKLLQMRFLDLLPVQRLAHHFNVAESTIFTMQRQAIERLAETLAQMEYHASTAQKALLRTRLEPASYVNLIGIQEHLAQLAQLLVTPGPPWLVAVEGIGGIGKTSIADALLRQLIEQGAFDESGWVSARQTRLNFGGGLQLIERPTLTAETLIEQLLRQLLPELAPPTGSPVEQSLRLLQARLKATPHLLVIDNLETVTDVEGLLPTLQTLAAPTKFLLTSRQSLYTEPNIYHFTVPELSEVHALELIKQEAAWSNLPVLAKSSDAELRPIVQTVGGNPLALRLVIGQTHIHALETLLDELRQAQGQTAENLYHYIYHQAWARLDCLSQKVLLIMPLTPPHGETLNYLAQVGNLPVGDVRLALNKLVMLNLVDARGGLNDRRYSIHGLTRTFLQEQVAKWF